MKKWRKWLSAGLLIAAIGIGSIAGTAVSAHAAGYNRASTVVPEERFGKPAGALRGKVSPRAWKKIDGVCYNGSGVEIPGAITRGIDVSEWQGKINWQKVKASDVDFAFVRISYGTGYIDKTFDYNMEQADLAGVPVGTYVYSLATNTKMALKEAQLAIEKMESYKVSYPVVFDLEYPKMGTLSPKKVSQIARTFCNEVKKAGYYPMVYCNLDWYNNHVNWSLLSGLDVWAASYGDKIQAPDHDLYRYTIWQSTDGDGGGVLNPTKGLIDGIPLSNNVDVNFGFVDYTKKIVPRRYPVPGYVPSETPGNANVVKKGWITEDGQTLYYVNGVKATGWKEIDGKYYYFGTTGYLHKSVLINENGVYRYVNKEGVRVSNKWVKSKGKHYFIGPNGCAVKGSRIIKSKRYFFDKKKAYLYKNRKVVTKAGNLYYAGSTGACYTRGDYKIMENGQLHTYRFSRYGRVYRGWHTIKGKRYYFYKGTGPMSGVRAENITLTSAAGIVSVFDENGVLVKQYKKK